jgi:hypothetical protein
MIAMTKPRPETLRPVYHQRRLVRARSTLALLGAIAFLAEGPAAAEGEGAQDAGAVGLAPAPAPPTATATPTATPTPTPTPTGAPTPLPPMPPPPPSIPPFTPPTPPAFTPPPDVRDANADRVIFTSTAYTHPAGTVYFTDYDVVILQAGYAITDGTQISVTSTIPIEGLVLADATIKTVVARDGPVRVAALGSVSGLAGTDAGSGFVGRVGAVSEMCFDDACRSSASAGLSMLLAAQDTIVGAALGFIWRVGDVLSLLGELDTVIPTSLQSGPLNGLAAAGGIRLPHRNWSLDLTLAGTVGRPVLTTAPVLAFTIRFLPKL